jgi:hemerythrin
MYIPRKIFWEGKYSTGDDNLDFQHKYLFETCNKLGDAIHAESSIEVIGVILGRLTFYADWHFGKEEERMDEHHCPVAEINKKAHADFMETFEKLHQEYNNSGGSLDLAIEIHEKLIAWLTSHIVGVDTKLHACIHRKPSSNEIS